jgi:predicted nucleic acid-binding protein
MLHRGALTVGLRVDDEVDRLLKLQRSYRELPMSLADACVVRLSELHERSRVLTTDTHFRVYRRHARQLIPLLVPPGIS